MLNSTVSGNRAGGNGGGIHVENVTLHVLHSTVTKNNANIGGGLAMGFRSTIDMVQSVLAINTARTGIDLRREEFATRIVVAARFTLIGSNGGSGFSEAPIGSPDANGNLIGGPMHGAIDPLLGPLANNGGPTLTHALLPGSPAIGAGILHSRLASAGRSLISGCRRLREWLGRGSISGRSRCNPQAAPSTPTSISTARSTAVTSSSGNAISARPAAPRCGRATPPPTATSTAMIWPCGGRGLGRRDGRHSGQRSAFSGQPGGSEACEFFRNSGGRRAAGGKRGPRRSPHASRRRDMAMALTSSFAPTYRPAGRDIFHGDMIARDAALQNKNHARIDALESLLRQLPDEAARFASSLDAALEEALGSDG